MFIKAIEKLRDYPKVVGMKGIFMQILYYDDCHIRLFNDLDLIVSPKEACELLSVFVDEGYTLKKGENVFDNNTLLIKFFGRTYFKKSCHVGLIKEYVAVITKETVKQRRTENINITMQKVILVNTAKNVAKR